MIVNPRRVIAGVAATVGGVALIAVADAGTPALVVAGLVTFAAGVGYTLSGVSDEHEDV
jgi:uncharacterized membrane protein YdfJ with MMPL/SSD domain